MNEPWGYCTNEITGSESLGSSSQALQPALRRAGILTQGCLTPPLSEHDTWENPDKSSPGLLNTNGWQYQIAHSKPKIVSITFSEASPADSLLRGLQRANAPSHLLSCPRHTRRLVLTKVPSLQCLELDKASPAPALWKLNNPEQTPRHTGLVLWAGNRRVWF